MCPLLPWLPNWYIKACIEQRPRVTYLNVWQNEAQQYCKRLFLADTISILYDCLQWVKNISLVAKVMSIYKRKTDKSNKKINTCIYIYIVWGLFYQLICSIRLSLDTANVACYNILSVLEGMFYFLWLWHMVFIHNLIIETNNSSILTRLINLPHK